MNNLDQILLPYNPWWSNKESAFSSVPAFKRPLYYTLIEDLNTIPQILSITGPRRIGKSTLLQQIIQKLIDDGIDPKHLIYYSFDDPALISSKMNLDNLIDYLFKTVSNKKSEGVTYLFLDEIQRLERWELYLKKYYDLKFPAKVIISGSASSPIFKKTRESLLGRVKDYHLLPFSFREFALYSFQNKPTFLSEINSLYEQGKTIQGMITGDPQISTETVSLSDLSHELKLELDTLLNRYFLEGGFPEVWNLPTWVSKQEYLYDNQVKKVIYEDLILAAEFRKPELLKRFYISLLEMPGREIAVQSISQETDVKSAQIDKYIPLLEMTDLVYKISKFRSGALRVRKGMMKFYLVDLALRNAVLRLTDTLLKDETMLGLYAENLVFLALKKWRGTIQMDYYRERNGEVDFVIHIAPNRYLPVEVKYRNKIEKSYLSGILSFVKQYPNSAQSIVVSKQWADYGPKENIFYIPLPIFLLLFD